MNTLASDTTRVLIIQSLLVLTVAIAVWLTSGDAAVRAALFGGACSFASAWMLGRRVRMAGEAARVSPGRETAILYIGAVQRFAVVLAMFLVGMGWLKLSPIPLLLGFGVPQAAYPLAAAWRQSAAG